MRHQFALVLALCLASSVWAQTPATQVAPPTPELELLEMLPSSPPPPPRVERPSAAKQTLKVISEADLNGTLGQLLLESPATAATLRALGSSTPIVFETNGAERMRIFSNGKAAFNGTTSNGQVSIYSYDDLGRGLYISHTPTIETSATQMESALWVSTIETIASGQQNNSAIIGTHTETYSSGPGYSAGIVGLRTASGYNGASAGTINAVYGALISIDKGVGTINNGMGLVIGDVAATNDWGIYQTGANDANYFAGDVGIGTTTPTAKLHVVGNIVATGSITGASVVGATYQDVAEWVPATSDLAPGTVVVLNTEKTNEVMASAHEYDTAVAGVVSAQPGIILGVASDSKEQIATTGRVKVRVDASFGAINVGDLLVTSNVPGTAMKSQPIEMAGRKIHQPGTIIGKALEPLASGTGEILVLLSLQ